MLHQIIKDEEVDLNKMELNNPRKRVAARGIVINSEYKIAVFYKALMNEYKLPGGGVEENEEFEEAFCREVMEETGCRVEIISKLGITEEFNVKSNFYQVSHVFLAKVVDNTQELSLTEKEVAEGGSLQWLSLREALKKMKNCLESLKSSPYDKAEDAYAIKFQVRRDMSILEYLKEMCDLVIKNG